MRPHVVLQPCRQAGRWQESARILQKLNANAVLQRQYTLAASLLYQLAMEALDEVCIGPVLCRTCACQCVHLNH